MKIAEKLVCPFDAAEMIDTLSPALGLFASALPCSDRYASHGGVHRRSGDILLALHGSESAGIPNVFGSSTTASESIESFRTSAGGTDAVRARQLSRLGILSQVQKVSRDPEWRFRVRFADDY